MSEGGSGPNGGGLGGTLQTVFRQSPLGCSDFHVSGNSTARMLSASSSSTWASKVSTLSAKTRTRPITSLKASRASSTSKRTIVNDYKKTDAYTNRSYR